MTSSSFWVHFLPLGHFLSSLVLCKNIGGCRKSNFVAAAAGWVRKVLRLFDRWHFVQQHFNLWQRRFLFFAFLQSWVRMVARPWWWSSGQRSCLLLRRSEFESCWLLRFSVRKDENKRKKRLGLAPLKKRLEKPCLIDWNVPRWVVCVGLKNGQMLGIVAHWASVVEWNGNQPEN